MPKKYREAIYNVDLERRLITDHNFDLTIQEIAKLHSRPTSITIETLVATIKRCLKVLYKRIDSI